MAEPDLPDEVALAAADRAILVEALRGLPEPDRTVIAYRYLLDRSEAETASLLSWPTGTVKSRTARALAKLRTRLGAAIAVGAAIALVLAVPPARQAMAHVLGRVLDFAGVRVHTGAAPAPTASTTPSPLPSTLVVSLDRARQVALFPIAVPAALGPPEQVVIADPGPDGTPRVVSLFWRAGTLRLDEFDGQVELTFVKTAPDVVWLDLNGAPAMWLNQPHQLEYVDRSGALRSDTIRVAGPTLVWLGGAVTYRLEGAGDQADSIAIATSLVSR
jgi:hypothetical protein